VRAARALFAQRGFTATSLRAVAARAKVDAALVHYFFKTKEQLFREVVQVPPDGGPAVLPRGGEKLARYYLAELFPKHGGAITALLRAAVGDPGSVPALRRSLESAVVLPTANALEGRDATLRAELAGALVVGLFITRDLMRMQPLASVPLGRLTRRAGRALDVLLAAT
jgi:hypothetical protein